jgi:hypothetical protein
MVPMESLVQRTPVRTSSLTLVTAVTEPPPRETLVHRYSMPMRMNIRSAPYPPAAGANLTVQKEIAT